MQTKNAKKITKGSANEFKAKNKIPNRLIRVVLIIAGTLFVGLGVLGIIVP